jgi:hypothetical protein
MIFRRVREHLGRHSWAAVAIDLVIVIIGVFLGTQASNWNQDRIEVRQARDNRAMLIDDLRSNQQNLAMRKRYYQWVRAEALNTLAALDRPPSELGPQFLIDSYHASEILPWSLKRNAYDQIVAAGQFGRLGDAALRDQISNYYVGSDVTGVNLATIMPYRDTLRRAMPYAAQREIRTTCGEKISENSRGEPEMLLPGHCTVALDAAAIRAAIAQVRSTPGLALDLNRQLVDLDQKLVSVDVILRRAAGLQNRLERSS